MALPQTPPATDIQNYTPGGSNGIRPPDPQIAVSSTHIVVVSSLRMAFYDKTGNLLQSQNMSSFFDKAFLSDNISKWNDGRAIFDPWRKRFWVGILGGDPTYHCQTELARTIVFVGVSKSEDPQDGWWLYSWDAVSHWGNTIDNVWQPGDSADYPSLGIDKNCLYQTNKVARAIQDPNNCDKFTGSTYRYWHVVLYPADKLAKGEIAPGSEFWGLTNPDGTIAGLIQPVIHHSTSPYAYFVSTYDTNKIAIWGLSSPLQPEQKMTVTHVTLPNTTYIAPGNCPQKGSPKKIHMDNLGNYPLKAVYRDNRLYLVLNDARDWFKDNNPTNSIRLVRLNVTEFPKISTSRASGFINRIFGANNRIEDKSKTRMYYGWPAMEVNRDGDIAIVYARSGETIYPEMRYSAYYATESDIRPSRSVRSGEEAYRADPDKAGFQRWGDLAGASVDPSNDTVIWIANQYASSAVNDGNNNYRIWITTVFV